MVFIKTVHTILRSVASSNGTLSVHRFPTQKSRRRTTASFSIHSKTDWRFTSHCSYTPVLSVLTNSSSPPPIPPPKKKKNERKRGKKPVLSMELKKESFINHFTTNFLRINHTGQLAKNMDSCAQQNQTKSQIPYFILLSVKCTVLSTLMYIHFARSCIVCSLLSSLLLNCFICSL